MFDIASTPHPYLRQIGIATKLLSIIDFLWETDGVELHHLLFLEKSIHSFYLRCKHNPEFQREEVQVDSLLVDFELIT